MGKDTLFYRTKTLRFGNAIVPIQKPLVMGILNLTPDSFFDGGKFISTESARNRISEMFKQGASIVDVGAVSTRPGASLLNEEEELNRLMPVFDLIKKEFSGHLFSIDTFCSDIARRAVLEYGFSMVNDITAGTFDASMFHTVTSLQVPYVMMHMQGMPAYMQTQPEYENVTSVVLNFLMDRIRLLLEKGFSNIVIDPGFGFGKTLEHNFTLLKNLPLFSETGYPVLAGISRKSMVYKLLNSQPEDVLHATGVVHTLALIQGADILRVHDVKEAIEVVNIIGYYRNL